MNTVSITVSAYLKTSCNRWYCLKYRPNLLFQVEKYACLYGSLFFKCVVYLKGLLIAYLLPVFRHSYAVWSNPQILLFIAILISLWWVILPVNWETQSLWLQIKSFDILLSKTGNPSQRHQHFEGIHIPDCCIQYRLSMAEWGWKILGITWITQLHFQALTFVRNVSPNITKQSTWTGLLTNNDYQNWYSVVYFQPL